MHSAVNEEYKKNKLKEKPDILSYQTQSIRQKLSFLMNREKYANSFSSTKQDFYTSNTTFTQHEHERTEKTEKTEFDDTSTNHLASNSFAIFPSNS